MAPPGGARPVVGNNPISCAVPRTPPHPPIVLDMALSEVAFGKIRLAAVEKRPIPLGWAFDSRGAPDDGSRGGAPRRATRSSGAAQWLRPVRDRGSAGRRPDGFPLRDGRRRPPPPRGRSRPPRHRNQPRCFCRTRSILRRGREARYLIKAVPLAEGGTGVFLPGEPEWDTAQVRLKEGIPISDELARRLVALARRLGVEGPRWR
jgi:LDH2 family malate/lactate/ureidoglycolate dehydrogenase